MIPLKAGSDYPMFMKLECLLLKATRESVLGSTCRRNSATEKNANKENATLELPQQLLKHGVQY